jgi:hypothetical protein
MTASLEQSSSLPELINKAHSLWNEIEHVADPVVRKLCFERIAEIEKLVEQQIAAQKRR